MLTVAKKVSFALYNESGQLTDYTWDGSCIDKNKKFITLYNEEQIDVYDIYTEKCIMSITDIEYLEICEKCIIVKKYGRYGAINFCGQEIVPFKYDYIKPQKDYMVVIFDDFEGVYFYNNSKHVPAAFEFVGRNVASEEFEYYFPVKYKNMYGYYVFCRKRFYQAEGIEVRSTGEIRLCKNGVWRWLKNIEQ